MPNHPEHDEHVSAAPRSRRVLLGAGVIALAVVLVVLHLSGVIGGAHA